MLVFPFLQYYSLSECMTRAISELRVTVNSSIRRISYLRGIRFLNFVPACLFELSGTKFHPTTTLNSRNMKIRFELFLIPIFISCTTHAQLSVQAGFGYSKPITGYKTITKGGTLYQFDFTRRLIKNSRWGIGLTLGWARMHRDNNESDIFGNARLDQVPVMVCADYEILDKEVRPYVGFGLGISFYNLAYDVTSTTGEAISNVSFSAMPRIGVRVPVDDNWFPFAEINCPIVFDGPPQGAGKSDKATGYVGIAFGASYRFGHKTK
jgi:hypothetical protein